MTVPDRASDAPPPFAAVMDLHGPAVLRFCRARAGADRGDDVFQETMLAALRAYGNVRDQAAIRAWLFSIAARKAVDAHRASARAAVPLGSPSASVAEVPAGASTVDDGVWDDVARLPEKQRQAVTLRYMADLTHAEVAVVMGISEDAVRRNVFEGLRRLRRDLTAAAE
jgi:RNA polymerase sigma factor (sigma-70 family)